ncbi:hypothetical protein [Actinoallomurus iriomotensis]|uniref:Uncharacterized protein n=1 Tax=Actinoallomurus iriomotensis TaxID=478107 RepID=A0A9W6SBG8_9ACTN|nr:hypothetical protein [Actinoallomurus iriomotensis]GLY89395.1 hypothetical protein Airi02_073240 [Actinoallomurus iriomotensis]
MFTVKPNHQPGDGALARHREGAEPVRECRWTPGPVAARPREAGRDVGRVVQLDAWIGPAAELDGAGRGNERADQPDSRRRSGEHLR